MRKTSVIIVNYNTCELLKKCLQNLVDLNESLEIIVVDNASTDGSADMVRIDFADVKLFALDKNAGLSVASNIGLDNAKGEYILYLGSDAFPKKGSIVGLEEYFDQNSQVGIASAKLVLRDGSLDMDAHRGFPTPWTALTHFGMMDKLFKHSKLFAQYFIGFADLNVPHEIDLCISHFMFARKKALDSVGKWDEDYFVFGEDVDMCYRVKLGGWKIMYLPEFEAVHYKGASVGIRKETQDISPANAETKIRMMKMKATGMELFYKKHYQQKYPAVLNGLVLSAIYLLNWIRMCKIRLSVLFKSFF
jgi:GT2 family glycosyltransferase